MPSLVKEIKSRAKIETDDARLSYKRAWCGVRSGWGCCHQELFLYFCRVWLSPLCWQPLVPGWRPTRRRVRHVCWWSLHTTHRMSSPGYSTTTTPGETDRLHLSPVISLHVCPRFVYTYTDGRGWPTYQYVNSQGDVIYLHFYDEGLFYDGFYVINDLEVRLENIGEELWCWLMIC